MESKLGMENGKMIFTLRDYNDNVLHIYENKGGSATISINGSEYIDISSKYAVQEIVHALGQVVSRVYFEDTDDVDILEIAI